jgi:hypothetical protein
MIAITISGKAYAAIAPTLPPGSVPRDGNIADGEFHVWLPEAVVARLRALRKDGETFSDVIMRVTAQGSYAAIIRKTLGSEPNAY